MKANLLALALERDDKINVRVPKQLKRELMKEATRRGVKLSAHLLAILLSRGKS